MVLSFRTGEASQEKRSQEAEEASSGAAGSSGRRRRKKLAEQVAAAAYEGGRWQVEGRSGEEAGGAEPVAGISCDVARKRCKEQARQKGKRGAGSSSDSARSAVVKKGDDAGEMSGGSCKWGSEVQVAGGAQERRRSRWGRACCRYQMSSGSCKWRSEVQVAGGAQKRRRSRWGRAGCRYQL
jgi:hypothetical protein